jgi:hypothetical protein
VGLPPCTIANESAFVDVGRGVAVVTLDARVSGAPCVVDAGSVLRAREEGRAPPELIAFRIELNGKPAGMGGPRGRVIAEVTHSGDVRFVAVVRGDRFIAVPLTANPAHSKTSARVVLRTRSVFGPHRVAGIAGWIEAGVPIVVTVDPTRDREDASLTMRVDGKAPVPVLIVDGGPIMGGDVTVVTEDERTRALARGGVDALSVLLSDLPLAVATAGDGTSALVRLRELSRAARAAAIARDPLISAIGQRLATAIVRGFTTCIRGDHAMPARWPTPLAELTLSGLLDEAESGCPRIDDLLAVNHPDVRFAQEGSAALAEASSLPFDALPRIGPVATARSEKQPGKRRHTAALAGALFLLLALGLFAERASR